MGGETADKVTDEEPEDRVRRKSVANDEEQGDDEENKDTQKQDSEKAENTTAGEEKKGDGDEDDEEDEVDCLGVPKPDELGEKIFTYFSYPWYIFFMLTIPDCE